MTMRRSLLFIFRVAILALVFFFVLQIVLIQLRLSRNGALASQLANSLKEQFPGIEFRGNASYEREVIYISVMGGIEEATRRRVEVFLRAQKIEQKIAPEILLRFSIDNDFDFIKM